jgi:hypothetical protein
MNNDQIQFQVTTNIYPEQETIEQTVNQIMGESIVNTQMQILNLKDSQVRQALINLGWTPPGPRLIIPIDNPRIVG